MILVIQAGGGVICLKEKELTSKLELLYNKSLYLLALNLAQSQKVSQVASVHAGMDAWKTSHITCKQPLLVCAVAPSQVVLL